MSVATPRAPPLNSSRRQHSPRQKQGPIPTKEKNLYRDHRLEAWAVRHATTTFVRIVRYTPDNVDHAGFMTRNQSTGSAKGATEHDHGTINCMTHIGTNLVSAGMLKRYPTPGGRARTRVRPGKHPPTTLPRTCPLTTKQHDSRIMMITTIPKRSLATPLHVPTLTKPPMARTAARLGPLLVPSLLKGVQRSHRQDTGHNKRRHLRENPDGRTGHASTAKLL